MGINAPFLDQPDEDLICQICHGVLDKPVTHCQQGHTYCAACIKGWMHRPNKAKAGSGDGKAAERPHCPGCMLPLGPEVRNLVAQNLVGKLRVRCKNSSAATAASTSSSSGPSAAANPSEGEKEDAGKGAAGNGGPKCGWTGRLEELEHHCRANCQYETIKCPHHHHHAAAKPSANGKATNPEAEAATPEEEGGEQEEGEEGCQFSGWRRVVMGSHVGQCPHRPVGCSLACGWRGKKLEEARHQGTVCPKVVLYCSNKGCHASFERSAQQEHYEVLCPFQAVPCVFAPHGCPIMPLRKDQAKHQAEAAVEHASLTSGKITDLEKGMETILQRFEDLRQRVEHSEKATRDTIVSLVANPHPGIWIILHSRIRSWNGGALLGAMNRGAIGYDRLSHAIDLFLDGVVSSTLPSLPASAPTSTTTEPTAAAAAAAPVVDAGLREAAAAAAAALRQGATNTTPAAPATNTDTPQQGQGGAGAAAGGNPSTPSPSSSQSLDDALKLLARLQQQGGQGQPGGAAQAGCFFPSSTQAPGQQSPQSPPEVTQRRGRGRNNSLGNVGGLGVGSREGMQFHRVEGNVVAFIEEVDGEPN